MEKTMQNHSTNYTVNLVLCGLFAALTAVCAAISIPLPFTPVPISLTTLSVLLAGGLLGAKFGALSQTVYLLLGAIGVPVFANFTGGLGIVMGPTGGYIVGYIAAAFVFGLLTKNIMDSSANHSFKSSIFIFIAGVLATIACYVPGTIWFMHVTGMNFSASFGMCILPFIPGDLLKAIAATLLVKILYPATRRYVS